MYDIFYINQLQPLVSAHAYDSFQVTACACRVNFEKKDTGVAVEFEEKTSPIHTHYPIPLI